MTLIQRWMSSTALILLCGGVAGWAQADDRGTRTPQPWPKVYMQECTACHVAYPASMLPAASWNRLMTGLEQHFGTDASIDPQDAARISHWLNSYADTSRHASQPVPEDRITRTKWFQREHRHIEPAVWRLPSVRSAANCVACHSAADQGRFNEHDLRFPAGLTPQQRTAWDD